MPYKPSKQDTVTVPEMKPHPITRKLVNKFNIPEDILIDEESEALLMLIDHFLVQVRRRCGTYRAFIQPICGVSGMGYENPYATPEGGVVVLVEYSLGHKETVITKGTAPFHQDGYKPHDTTVALQDVVLSLMLSDHKPINYKL